MTPRKPAKKPTPTASDMRKWTLMANFLERQPPWLRQRFILALWALYGDGK